MDCINETARAPPPPLPPPPLRLTRTVGAPTDVLHHDVPLNPALADRQEACHPHQVRVDLTQQWALVPDLGASRVWIYGLPG
eukprot:COSAG06_NODE_13672_length_1233_cov_0.914462_1_plen_81_part_10